MKLSVAEKISAVLSNIIALLIVLTVFVFSLYSQVLHRLFVFAKLTGEYYWGFLIVAGIYGLTGILVWTLKEKIIRLPIMNAILQQLFKEENDEQDQ